MAKKASKQSAKRSVKKRTLNPPGGRIAKGAPFNEQDPKRRLGNYESAGEHARQGGRQAGIVGQRKQKLRTDKKSK